MPDRRSGRDRRRSPPHDQPHRRQAARHFSERAERKPDPQDWLPRLENLGLRFEELRVPARDDSGSGKGFEDAAASLGLARAHTAALSIGLAQAALEDAIAYARERVQFGEPISNFQAIRFKIATMATEVEAARQLMYHVCTELDAGRPARAEISMVKYFASEMSERVTSEALQIFGGAGYTTLHAVERHWRDTRLTKIFEGTSEIQQRIIADVLLGKPVKPS
ncbi:acyl-CoA dehydrogenase family protein [Sphingobium sp. JS3065]|uniref:acyl-CoA dehydrogenase family protein n=1 Tax=Sphingobium sp. JS3065 TaxID=2970925 RepID=UPI0022656BF4|nr:acyl-CoA dehydrogenase family protein [Sphingobium sp. JS3065]UZW57520.1 acyl-CoA dehydrogenase family protein [Sphingobium sp. JS3065]